MSSNRTIRVFQDCLPFGSADFTGSAALSSACSKRVHLGCALDASHRRQTRRLQDPGKTHEMAERSDLERDAKDADVESTGKDG